MILLTASQTEIHADKRIAIALLSNRIKWRDLWDMVWLTQRDIAASPPLLAQKAADRDQSMERIAELVSRRIAAAAGDQSGFAGELERFLPVGQLRDAARDPRYWEYPMKLVPTLVPAE